MPACSQATVRANGSVCIEYWSLTRVTPARPVDTASYRGHPRNPRSATGNPILMPALKAGLIRRRGRPVTRTFPSCFPPPEERPPRPSAGCSSCNVSSVAITPIAELSPGGTYGVVSHSVVNFPHPRYACRDHESPDLYESRLYRETRPRILNPPCCDQLQVSLDAGADPLLVSAFPGPRLASR